MTRLYHMLALIALINLFAIAGLLGYLFASGRLSAERVDQIAKVMRGEFPASQPASQPAAASAPAPPEPSRAEIERIKAHRQYYDLVAERHQRELQYREQLNQRILFEVNSKLEEIEREKKLLAQQRQEMSKASGEDGFAQMVEIFSNMDPNKARDLLRTQTKEADAVSILSRMETGRSKKIFNACKTEDEKLWLGRILNQIRQGAASGAGVDGPKPGGSAGADHAGG
jgi:flagellar motility protein MotE (MotC chaperone)